MSNPYLNFLASLGGPTGSHSTLQKLASNSPATAPPSASAIASSRPQASSFPSSRNHSTAAPRAPTHLAGKSSSSLSHSSKSSRPSQNSTVSSHRHRLTPSSCDRDGHAQSSHHSSSSSRNHDRADSINYRNGQDHPYSNSSRSTKTSRDFHDAGRSSNGVRSDRKHQRNADREVSDYAGSTGRMAKDLSISESGPKKRRARSRSRSQSRSRSPRRNRNRDVERSRGRSQSRNRTRSRSRSRSRSKSKSRKSRSRSTSRSVNGTRPFSPATVDVKVTEHRPSTPPPRTPPQHELYHDVDDVSSLSTLSSPASSSMSLSTTTSPILRSAQLPQSPSKQGLSPLKKRHLEDILQAEASYSSPSSLSSLSPDRSNRTSYDRELGVSSVDPSTPAEAEAARHDFTSHGNQTDRLDKEPVSQQSLELELFGAVLSDSSRASNGGDTNGLGSTINGERTLPKSSKLRSSLESERKKRMDPQRSFKKTSGHSGRAQLQKGVREIVTINTIKGIVTTSIVKTPSPVKRNQGSATQTVVPAVQANTTKDVAQKPAAASANGNGASSTRRMSILHSDQIVAAAMSRYKNHFHMIVEDSDSTVASSPSSAGADTMHVSLEYPGKDSKEKFTLMKPFLSRSKTESDDKDEYNPIEDLVQTVRIIMEHFFDPQQYRALFGSPTEGLYRSLTKYKNRKDGAQFLKAVEDFNVVMRKQKAQGTIQEYLKQYGHRLPYDLVVHLLQQVYSRTVAARASKLNQYEAFSNNVYGEILPILTKEFIQRTKLDKSKVFVDLGCGIGNVVLQVALQTGAESYGVEIMDTPAKFAKKQAKEFEARSRAFGLSHGPVTMLHGDFLDTPGLPAILAKADVVLVNNYAFNSALNQSLLQLFLDLKEGCKIISLKTFVSLDHKINVRNAGSVESILRVKKYPYYTNAVSWTHNGGEYYIATVDRTAVQAFWERAMAGGAAALDDGSSRRASSRRR